MNTHHLVLPVVKVFRHNLREIICSVFWSLSDLPHKTPFGIKYRFNWTDWLILFSISLHSLGMLPSFLLEFRAHTDLVMALRLSII